jgi:hypothetical protein
MNSRKKLIAGGVVAGSLMLGAAGLVVGAGLAKADVGPFRTYGYEGDHNPTSLVLEMGHVGWTMTTEQARETAYGMCGERINGTSERTLIRGLERNHTIEVSITAVSGAEYHFCPAYEENPQTDPEWQDGPSVPPMRTVEPNPPSVV